MADPEAAVEATTVTTIIIKMVVITMNNPTRPIGDLVASDSIPTITRTNLGAEAVEVGEANVSLRRHFRQEPP